MITVELNKLITELWTMCEVGVLFGGDLWLLNARVGRKTQRVDSMDIIGAYLCYAYDINDLPDNDGNELLP